TLHGFVYALGSSTAISISNVPKFMRRKFSVELMKPKPETVLPLAERTSVACALVATGSGGVAGLKMLSNSTRIFRLTRSKMLRDLTFKVLEIPPGPCHNVHFEFQRCFLRLPVHRATCPAISETS